MYTHTHTQTHTHTHIHTHTCAHMQSDREPRCARACAWRMCMGHMHVHADGHSGHVLVECVMECVRADCLLVLCPGTSSWAPTRSACCRRASLTSSRRFGEGARVAGGMGPWEFVGACVALCDFADVYAACMCVRVSIDIPMHTLSYTYLS